MPAFSIRLAKAEDVPAIVALLRDDFLGKGREDSADLSPYLEAFSKMEEDPNNALYVLDVPEIGVGGTFQLIYMHGLSLGGCTRAEVEAVRVHASLRGQGFGKKMFEWAIAKAKEDGCGLLQLTTNKARKDGQRFYDQLGFEASHVGYKLKL
ncbi:MAG: GNAT family N-acetyltransferase [Cohaesibacter sp.]|jgi:GNAT superfamily N-acetyltransferase|nr:GNAT family N-acetyltransferase [Cohaesibacter sp.]